MISYYTKSFVMEKKEVSARETGRPWRRSARPLIGAHMSIAGGMHKAFQRGVEVGCRTIQVFVKSPTCWQLVRLAETEREAFAKEASRTGIAPVVAHASYLVNVGSPDDALWQRSVESLVAEMKRAAAVGATDLVLHPGSSRDADRAFGMKRVVRALRIVLNRTKRCATRVALETTAGAGATLGGRFEDLAELIERTGDASRLSVCFDTCHVHAAGYDIRSARQLRATVAEFDEIVGLGKIGVLHLNDCKAPIGSHIDRHQHIGKGMIGMDAFRVIMRARRFAAIPKIIETPKTDSKGRQMDRRNLRTLERLARDGR